MPILTDDRRGAVSFHSNTVRNALPDFFDEHYPQFIGFLEKYYEYMEGNEAGSFSKQIQSLFESRTISNLEGESLDLLLGELSDGLESRSFYSSPNLMARLLADLYRAKGTEMSLEQFFKAFFGEEVEIHYPKNDMFIVGESKLFGKDHSPLENHSGEKIRERGYLRFEDYKYIQDNERYQIFSILLKTGMSFADYEELYKKIVHPAGFHIANDIVLTALAKIGVRSGPTTDPLEVPNYPILVEDSVDIHIDSLYALLTMRETDPVDIAFILSSLETLARSNFLVKREFVLL